MCYVKATGGSGRFLAYKPAYTFNNWFFFYIIQCTIYYIMVRQKCFGYDLRKHESRNIYFHLIKIFNKFYNVLNSCIYLIKSLFQWGVWLIENFKEERALFSLILWYNYIFTMFAAIPICIIALMWEHYAISIAHSHRVFVFITGYLGGLVVTTCCLLFMMRFVIAAYISKDFIFKRTGRFKDDAKFCLFLMTIVFCLNSMALIIVEVISEQGLLFSSDSIFGTIYQLISRFIFQAVTFYFMIKRKSFGFSIEKRQVSLTF